MSSLDSTVTPFAPPRSPVPSLALGLWENVAVTSTTSPQTQPAGHCQSRDRPHRQGSESATVHKMGIIPLHLKMAPPLLASGKSQECRTICSKGANPGGHRQPFPFLGS